jgi:signal transduction histidine kinase
VLFSSTTIRSRLFRSQLIGLAICVLAVIAAWNFYVAPALRLNVAKGQVETATRAAERIRDFLDARTRELQMTSEIGSFWHQREESQKEALSELLEIAPEIEEVSIVDPDGQEQVRMSRERSLTKDDLRRINKLNVFREAVQGKAAIGPVYYSPKAEPNVAIAVPIEFDSARVYGVLKAVVSLKNLWNSVSEYRVGNAGYLYVVDGKGNLVAHPDYSKVALALNMSHVSEVAEFLRERTKDPNPGKIDIGENGDQVLGTFAAVPRTDWAVIVEEPVKTAFAEIQRVKLLASIVLLLAIAGVIGVSNRFSNRIGAPVRDLEKGAEIISAGNLDHRLNIRTGDELESLSDKFNRMAQALKESRYDLEQKITNRTREISALYAALAPLKPSESLQSVLETVIERLIEATGADAALIRLKQEDRPELFCPASRGFNEEYLKNTATPAPQSAVMRVLTGGRPIIASDIGADPRLLGKKQIDAGLRSCAILPLVVSGETRGIIHVASRTVGFFNADKEDHLMAIARQMCIAIENHELFTETHRLFDETRQRAREQEALNIIAGAISQSLDPEDLFQVALDKLVEVTGRGRASIRLKNEETGRLELRASRGLSQEEVEDLRGRMLHRASEQVFATGEPMVVDESGSGDHRDSLLPRSRSVAWIPMKSRANVIGVLGISAPTPIPFSAREMAFLQAIANVIGVALDNARSYEQVRQNLERIRGLHEIDKAILSSLELKKVLNVLLEQIELFLPFPAATTIRLFNRKTSLLEPAACRGLDEAEWRKTPSITAISNPVFVTNAPFKILDLQKEPGPLDGEFLAKNHLVSLLIIPLLAKGETMGVLSFYTRETHDFSIQETDFLVTLAGQAAIAIHNSQLYSELRMQAHELERSNNVKSEFLGIMSHELTTPITAITGYATLIEEDIIGEANPEQRRAAGVIRRKSEELLLMIRTILEATKLESGDGMVSNENVDVLGLLQELQDIFGGAAEKPLSLSWKLDAQLPTIMTDRQKLKQVLAHLIDNAIKFTPEGAVTICAHHDIDTQAVCFEISDTGIGIAREMIPAIFEKFRQVDSSDTRTFEGIGLGLFVAKKLIDMLGGQITAASELGRGSTFTVTLPCGFSDAVLPDADLGLTASLDSTFTR